MREIKFRAKTLDISDFVYGSLIQGKQFSGVVFAQIENADANDYQLWQVDPETVGQYTGLLDSSGKEIYEGDVVDCFRYQNDEKHTVIIENITRLPSELFGSNLNKRIVVGNIYQPPELLK